MPGARAITCDLLLGIACEMPNLEAGLEDVNQVHVAQ